MYVEYKEVHEYPDSYYPIIDFREEFGKDVETDGLIFLSNHVIQFYSPLSVNKDDDGKDFINLKRDDTITGYTNDKSKYPEPLWKVTKEADGTVTLWPSIIWMGRNPNERQHFWFRNNTAIVLGDSWIFNKVVE